MKHDRMDLVAGVIVGGVISVVMEILTFGLIINGIVNMAERGEFLPWVDKVFIAAWGIIFMMGLMLYCFSMYHLKEGAANEPHRREQPQNGARSN